MSKLDLQWWTYDDPSDSAWSAYSSIYEGDSIRRDAYLRYLRLYSNTDDSYVGSTPADVWANERASMNVVKSIIDTVASKIAKSKPKAAFLTNAGNYTLKRKARLLERYVDAESYVAKMPAKYQDAFIDACILGTGVVKHYADIPRQHVAVERIFPGEILVDHIEGRYRDPRQLFQRKYVSREQLKHDFPEHAEAISRAPELPKEVDWGRDTTADQIVVVEGWHLPSSPRAGDGRHIIFIEGRTLFDEKWESETFPFVFLRWTVRRQGFWGQGLAEDLTGLQLEINRLLQKIQKIFHLLAVPRVYVEQGSKVNKAQMTNMVGCIVPYVGSKPIIDTSATVNAEVFNHLKYLISSAYEVAGISQDTAGGNVPQGLDEASGIAILRQTEVQTTRYALAVQMWEEAHCEGARLTVACGKMLSKAIKGYSPVTSKDRYTIATVKWSDVDMDEDAYVLKVFPASSMPDLPSGKIKMILGMQGLGIAQDPQTVAKLLDFPDLESEFALDRASSDDIDRQIELMLDEGGYDSPEPFQDLQLALKKVQSAYLKARMDGVPEERLALLREYMATCQDMIMASQPAPQPMPDQAGIPPAVTSQTGAAPGATTGNEVM